MILIMPVPRLLVHPWEYSCRCYYGNVAILIIKTAIEYIFNLYNNLWQLFYLGVYQ